MFRKPVAVSSEQHGRLRFTPVENLGFARGLSHVPVLAFELKKIAEQFPIVFRTETGLPMAMFGLLKGRNAYLTPDNRWCASVIPSALSCYPFGLHRSGGDDYILIMDAEASALQASKGKLLYNKQGEGFRPSPMLKAVKSSLETIEQQRQITTAAFAQLSEQGVLVEHKAEFTIDGEKHYLGGFSVLDWEKVQQVKPEVREEWERNGMMELMQAQTESLSNFKKLLYLQQKHH